MTRNASKQMGVNRKNVHLSDSHELEVIEKANSVDQDSVALMFQ